MIELFEKYIEIMFKKILLAFRKFLKTYFRDDDDDDVARGSIFDDH